MTTRTPTPAHIRSLQNAYQIGALRGAIQLALIDLEYGHHQNAVAVLTAALAKEKAAEAEQYAIKVCTATGEYAAAIEEVSR